MTSGSVAPLSQQTHTLNTAQTDSLVNRLCKPRSRKQAAKPPGEEIVLRTQEKSSKLKAGGLDIASIVARLAAPRAARALSPTPGERVVLMWNRSENLRKPDLQRINDLAKASRRGASARAWGVFEDRPNTASVPMPPPPRPPESARGPQRPRPMQPSKYEGNTSPEAALPPLELPQTAPESGQVTPKVRSVQRPIEGNLPDNSQQDMGQTWAHPWRDRSGVDRQA